jgi:hypothetical protein
MHIYGFRDIKEHRRRKRFLDAMHKKLETKERNLKVYDRDTGQFKPYDLSDHMTELLD